jgi:heme-degrading monooxygenase HmoA
MFAVVRKYSVRPGGARELAERVEREFLPLLKSVPGFVSYTYLEGEHENGKDVLATFSVFESRDGADESVRQAAAWVAENLIEFSPSRPIVTAGKILVSTHYKTG